MSELTITDPRDGSTVGTLPCADADAVAAAVQTAAAAQPGWARTAPTERGSLLKQAARALADVAEELAEMNQRETGKPLEDARGGVEAAVGTLEQYAELGPLHRGHALRGGITAADYTVAEPRGVVAVVTPWNDPVAVAAGLLGAAIVTGNTVVHKPSERCPHVGARLGEVLAAALPDGVLVSVTGDAEVGEALITQPDVAMVAHVGSTAAGRRIQELAVSRGAQCIRENGGNDPLIVDADVDPVWAAGQAALGSFANTGQICTSVERILVHRQIAEDFVAALVQEATSRNTERALGPLVDERMRRTVHEQVSQALEQGAHAEVGGVLPEGAGSWYPATVLTGCRPEMAVMAEETFGPVAPVQVVDSFDEAVELAVADRYGLAATVLTGSIAHAHRAVAALPVGTVKVNAVFGGAPGGSAEPRKDSGSGFGYGPELMDEMTRVKVVHLAGAP